MPQGHLSGRLEKACNHTYLNKRKSVYDEQERVGNKWSSFEKKKRVKYGLRTSRKWFGLSTDSSEGSSASAPQKTRRKSSQL
jgi:hypothetical protein